ncbi:nuclease-related domain-containing protein [Tuberibacillus sp. Marseille-P3662]|uniref:nuclease-related domain-containing protein n=1 Tax=Tuberibacillus sp. Marseille-P3662 TaxID=1965358 RepID=UPI000A1CC69F|nr:nuclease-related domain-containing protein [Tuberibacillus sp. Marseille-P3662]
MKLLELFKKKAPVKKPKAQPKANQQKQTRSSEKIAARKGDIGEYKIDIQLSQLPKEYRCLNDIMINNPRSVSGYSQIDHIVLSPYGIFVIETKNYQGTIYGGKHRKTWLINGKFKMLNPVMQNDGHIKALKQYVDKKFDSQFISLISFTKRCKLKIDNDMREISSDEMVIYDLYLSETINRKVLRKQLQVKEPMLSQVDIQNIYNTINAENITDPKVREEHNRAITTSKDQNNQPKCAICDKPVSQKVKQYCLSNKSFKGKIYCFEHQKRA